MAGLKKNLFQSSVLYERYAYIILLSLLFICVQNKYTYGAIYYVSSSQGKDSYSGKSPQTPWKTLQNVNKTKFLPGNKILLKRGDTWRESLILRGSGKKDRKIILSSYGQGEKPILNGTAIVCDWSQYSPGIYTKKDLRKTNGLLENGKPLRQASSRNLVDGRWFMDKGTIYYRPVFGEPKQHLLERANRGSLLHLKESEHLVIENISFYGANSYGLRLIDCSNIDIVNCLIVNSGKHGVSLQRNRAELVYEKITVKENILRWNANGVYIEGKGGGFKSNGYNYCKITNNIISHTNYDNVWQHSTKDGHAIGIQNSSFCTIEKNSITDNYSGIALWTSARYFSNDNHFLRNYVNNNHLYGIVHGSNGSNNSMNNVWAFNIIANNGSWPGRWGGLRINRVQDQKNYYYNNTLCNNDINIYLYSFPDFHLIKNNLSINPLDYHIWLDVSAGDNNVIDNNFYFSNKGKQFYFRKSQKISFAKWKVSTIFDLSSAYANSIRQFGYHNEVEDYCLFDERLLAGDTSIWRHATEMRDFIGNIIGNSPFIGACLVEQR